MNQEPNNLNSNSTGTQNPDINSVPSIPKNVEPVTAAQTSSQSETVTDILKSEDTKELMPENEIKSNSNNENVSSVINSDVAVENKPILTENVTSEEPTLSLKTDNSDNTNLDNKDYRIIEKKPIKTRKWLFVIIIIVVLAMISFGIYYLINSNTKNILSKGIDQLGNRLSLFDDSYNLDINKGSNSKGTIKLTVNSDVINKDILGDSYESIAETLKILNKTNLKYDIKIKENKQLISLIPDVNNEEIADINLYMFGNKAYFFIEKLFDKYVEISEFTENFDMSNYLNPDDYQYLLTFIGDSLVKNMDDKYITKSSSKIDVAGKQQSVNKVTFKINEKEIIGYLNKVLDDVKKDKKANKIVTDIYPKFKDYKIDDTTVTENLNEYSFIVYTTKLVNSVVGTELNVKYYDQDIDEVTFKEKTVESNIKLIYTSGDDTMKLYTDSELVGSLIFKDDKNKTTITLYDKSKKDLGYLIINSSKNNPSIEFKFEISGVSINGKLSTSINETVKNKEYSQSIDAKIVAEMVGIKIADINLKITDKTIYGIDDFNVDTSNSVKYESLTDEQISEIENNLYTIISKIFG